MKRIAFLSLLVMAGLVAPALAADGECKVCQPVTETKKVSKRVYSSVYEDFCLPRASFLGGLFGRTDCAACQETRCGPVHTKKYLVVKIRTHEECVTKCVPKTACEQPAIVAPLAPAATPKRP